MFHMKCCFSQMLTSIEFFVSYKQSSKEILKFIVVDFGFGHLMRRSDSLGKTLMLRKIEGLGIQASSCVGPGRSNLPFGLNSDVPTLLLTPVDVLAGPLAA